MKPLTREWLTKAERDFRVVRLLVRGWESGYGDAACFHCQQAVEKYLKARLCESGHAIPYVHDLPTLLNLVVSVEPLWASFGSACQTLTPYAVQTRYPGNEASKADAPLALKYCRAIRREARHALGLKS